MLNQKRSIYWFLLILFIGCQTNESVPAKSELRDSLMSLYLSMGDSVQWTDTLDPNRKLLRAYNTNDTVYLRGVVADARDAIHEMKIYKTYDCEETPPVYSF